MENIISDKGAMDPEVMVPGDKRVLWRLNLCRGIPQSWALAVFIVCSVAVSTWNFAECIVGLIVVALMVCLQGTCGGLRQTTAGSWLLLLNQCCHLAGVVMGLRAALQYMAGHSFWLTSQMALWPRLVSLVILTFIITLHALGLERSRILRWGLLVCVHITYCVIIFGETLVINADKAKQLFDLQFPSLNAIASSAAFFSLVFSNSLNTTDKKVSYVLLFPINLMLANCFCAVAFLSLALMDIRGEALGEVLFFTVLEKEGSHKTAWHVSRGVMAVLSMTSLSLTLVEVVADAQRRVVGLAGVLLPHRVARDHWWTGTKLSAIIITGLVSAVLVLLPLHTVISMSSASYLLSQACDIIFVLYTSYLPSFVPKNCEEGGRDYQLLPDDVPLMDGALDNEAELSDDSGHSSDTDIDAVVHEYRQTVKVVETIEELLPTPTVLSFRIMIFCLHFIVAASLGMAWAIALDHPYIVAICVIVALSNIYVISMQPQETDKERICVSPWQLCLLLTLQLVLAALLLPQIWTSFQEWLLMGLVLWVVQNRKHWWSLSKHAEQVKLPRPQLLQNFQPSYQRLANMDAVQVFW